MILYFGDNTLIVPYNIFYVFGKCCITIKADFLSKNVKK